MSQNPRIPDDFATAFESAFARLQLLVLEACEGAEPWPARVAAAIHAALDFAIADPAATRVLAVDALLERAEGDPRYLRMLSYFAELLREGAPPDPRRPALTEEALVGGIAVIVADHLRAGSLDRLGAAAPELVELMLLPYLGGAEAKDWARRTARERPR